MGVAAEKVQAIQSEETTNSATTAQIRSLVNLVQNKPLPIFSQTRENLKRFDGKPSSSIPQIVQVLRLDPCFAHEIFVNANAGLAKSKRAPAATLNHAILVLGVPYVLNLGKELPLISDQKDAMSKTRILQILSRSYHAGIQAKEWMFEYSKSSAETAFITAQMSHLYLASLWYYAPDKMSALIKSKSQTDLFDQDGLLSQVGKMLAKQWRFSELLQESLDQNSDSSRLVDVVQFSNNVARLAESGWFSKPMENLFANSSTILDIPEDVLIQLTHNNSVIAARETTFYAVKPAACRLLSTERDDIKKIAKKATHKVMTPKRKKSAVVTEKKTSSKLQVGLQKLALLGKNKAPVREILSSSFELISEISDNNPIAFFLLNKNKSVLKSRFWANFSDQNKTILIDVDKNNIFKSLIKKPSSIYINSQSREKYKSLLPSGLSVDIHNQDFIAFSLFVDTKPIGVFYYQNSNSSPITTQIYKQFILVCKTTKIVFEEVNTHAK